MKNVARSRILIEASATVRFNGSQWYVFSLPNWQGEDQCCLRLTIILATKLILARSEYNSSHKNPPMDTLDQNLLNYLHIVISPVA